ncbi:ABC transporter ATP-binding protein [Microbacterium karelineae]|uniref:ABC transporter ATP-binding protein n=1 Tax=Microbacterium karelineae TaxID=2654283 RepID=UPI0012E9F54A|nr:ABC transporter ATP-binding protein [Microbacterium karelineae]
MSAISIDSVSKTYAGSAAPSVDGMSLDVEDGDFLCLLGPSGCGKSTTLRMIAGLEQPTAGRISIGDRIVDDAARGQHVAAERRGLGFVFQSYALWPHLTVRENIAFGLTMQKVAAKERRIRVDHALETLAIAAYAERHPGELSGGQQQRVAIARTLAARPAVMLLDEPLSNLDARLRLEMRAEFQRIHRETGTTMVFVTHDQWEAMTLATRIVVMDAGRVQQVGPPLEIYSDPANRFVAEFMGSPPLNVVEGDGNGAAARAMAAWRGAEGAAAIGVRPEALRFADVPSPGAFATPVTIEALLPTGGSWIVEATDGERRLFGTSTAVPAVREGERVTAWAEERDVLRFATDGSRADRLVAA